MAYRGDWVRSCYAHNGQHGECYDGMQRRKRATKEEYGRRFGYKDSRRYARRLWYEF